MDELETLRKQVADLIRDRDHWRRARKNTWEAGNMLKEECDQQRERIKALETQVASYQRRIAVLEQPGVIPRLEAALRTTKVALLGCLHDGTLNSDMQRRTQEAIELATSALSPDPEVAYYRELELLKESP